VEARTAARRLARGQGAWWATTGAWPLVHLPSFYAVTGPKREARPIDLADAVLEAGMALAWLGAARPRRGREEEDR
jgi:hypothetical protein